MLTDFYGKSAGSGQCVPLVQQATGIGHTSTWSPGDQVVGNDSLTIGTPIATFDPNGRYGNHTNHTSHAAIYLGPGETPGSIRVLDQWAGHPASERTIRPDGHSPVDQSGNYRVVVASANPKQGYGGGQGAPSRGQAQSQTNPAYDELEQELRGPGGAEEPQQPAVPATTAQPPQSSQGAPPSGQYDQLEQELRGPGGAEEPQQAANANQPQPQAAPEPPQFNTGPVNDITLPPTSVEPVTAAIGRVGRNVTDLPHWLLAKAGDVTGVNKLLGLSSADQVAQQNANDLAAYRQKYGDNPSAQLTEAMGNTAVTLPVMGPIGRGAEVLTNALLRGGRLASLAAPAVSGAAQGAGAALETAGGSDKPVGEQVMEGAKYGGALGAAGGAVGGAINALTSGLSPERAALARLARQRYGIPVTGDQLAGSPSGQVFASTVRRLPLSGAGQSLEDIQTGLNRAVGQTFGATDAAGNPAVRLTDDVLDRVRARLGRVFDGVSQRVGPFRLDQQFGNDIAALGADMRQTLEPGQQAPLLHQINDLKELVQNRGGTLDGASYQALTRRGTPLDRLMRSDNSNVRYAAGQLRDALDGLLQRNAPADAVADLQGARAQWRAMLAAEDAADKSSFGTIAPGALKTSVRKYYGEIGGAGPQGQLGDLVRIAQEFVGEKVPNSGTPERLATMGLLHSAATIPPLFFVDPTKAAIAAAGIGGTLAAGRAAGSVLRSDVYTNALIGNALAGGPPPNLLARYLPAATIPALAGYQASQRPDDQRAAAPTR